MNPLYIAIAIIFVLLAALFWWFICGDAHDPLDSLDEYEDLARRCAKADFERKAEKLQEQIDKFQNDWPVKPARKT